MAGQQLAVVVVAVIACLSLGAMRTESYLIGLNIFSFNTTVPAGQQTTIPYMMGTALRSTAAGAARLIDVWFCCRARAAFMGASILTNDPTHMLNLPIRVPTDPAGCGFATTKVDAFGRSYNNSALLLFRNGCTFGSRIPPYAAMGVKLIVFHQCSPDAPFYCALGPFETVSSTPGMTIPSIQIDYAPGIKLRDDILAAGAGNNDVMLSVVANYAGADMHAGDRAALTEAWTTNPTLTFASAASGTQPWSSLNSTNIDPCRQRLMGIWCEKGRVVSVNLWNPGTWTGVLPNVLGNLTETRYLSIAGNKITSVGCGLAQLTKLQYLNLGSNLLTSLPSCLSQLVNVQQLLLGLNQFTQLPDLAPLTKLRQLDASNNLLTVITISPSWASALQIVSFLNNRINQALPSFANFAQLQIVDLSRNQFTSSSPITTYFDNCPELVAITLAQNSLSGTMPQCLNSVKVIKLDMSYNAFEGSIPMSWKLLSKLAGVYLQHNQLTSPFDQQLGQLPELTSLDLSYNLFNATVSDSTQSGDVGAVVSFGAGPALRSFNLGYNQLKGKFGTSFLSTKRSIVNLNLAGNQITTFPRDIFGALGNPFPPANTLPNIQLIDLSYNSMIWENQIAVESPLDTPPISLQLLKIQGNPGFVSPTVPPWSIPDANYVVDRSGLFACPSLVARPPNPSNLVLTCDPAFYQYKFCICANGTYGIAPNCIPIPFTTDPLAPIPSNQTISDTQYGEQRQTRGMDTNWVLGGVPGTRVMYIHFDISKANFSEFTDVIEVYEGPNIQGQLVVSFRGTTGGNINNLALDGVTPNTVVVLNNTCTVNFRSRASGGFHFNGTYDFSFDCPDGYSLPTDTDTYGSRCTPLYKWPTSTQIIVYAISTLTIVVNVVVLLLVLWNYQTLVIRAASGLFCILILAFNCLMGIGAYMMALDPAGGDGVCHARAWFTGLGVVGSLSCLIAKTERIRQIFTYTLTKQLNLSNWEVVKFVIWMMSAEIILLIVYSSYPFTYSALVPGTGSTASYVVWECADSETGYDVWIIVQFTYIVVFMVGGAFVAFYTRDVPLAYNETTQIVTGLWVLSFFGAIVVPLQYVVSDNPQALMLMRGVGEAFCSLSLTLIIFVPKVFLIVSGQANNRSITMANTSQLGSTVTTANTPTGPDASTTPGNGMVLARGGDGSGNNSAAPSTPKGMASRKLGAGATPAADAVALSRFPASVQNKIQSERAEQAARGEAPTTPPSAPATAPERKAAPPLPPNPPAARAGYRGVAATATLSAGFDDVSTSRQASNHSEGSAAASPATAGAPIVGHNSQGYKTSVRFSDLYPNGVPIAQSGTLYGNTVGSLRNVRGSTALAADERYANRAESIAPPPPPPDEE